MACKSVFVDIWRILQRSHKYFPGAVDVTLTPFLLKVTRNVELNSSTVSHLARQQQILRLDNVTLEAET